VRAPEPVAGATADSAAGARLELFVVTPPGLEALAAGELGALGLAGAAVEAGGVALRGTLRDLARANLALRTATRVLVRLGSFRASSFGALRARAAGLPWERVLRPGDALVLRVTTRRSRLWHGEAVAERVLEAAAARLGGPVARVRPAAADADDAGPDQLVVVRLERDRCTVSVDSSGAPLHRRGYRLAGARAPLRETLAAGLLLAAGWEPGVPLVDPFCGSGTLVLEAALRAEGRLPGAGRGFAFEAWPGVDAGALAALRAAAPPAPLAAGGAGLPLEGFDRDAGAVAAARANAERAGLGDRVRFAVQPVSALAARPGPGWVVSNPPHGVRLRSRHDLRDLYARLGAVLRRQRPGWRVALLLADPRHAAATGLPLEARLRLRHGGLPLALHVGRVPGAAA